MDAPKYGNGRYVDYRTLSDADFVRNLDLLASHYHSDYMRGRGTLTANVDSFLSRTEKENFVAPIYPKTPPRTVSVTGYFTRRIFFLALIFIISLVEIIYAVTSFFEISVVKEYLYMFGEKSMFTDAFSAVIGRENSLSSMLADDGGIFVYILAGLSVIYVLFSLISLVASICAACGKRRRDFTYKKVGLGGLSVVRLLCAIGMILCAFIAGITPVYTGCILVAAAPILTLIFSLLSYKKRTISVPETALDVYGKPKTDYFRSVIG
ncbi:MAG: hypothetical protein J5781_02960 [Clostridia bacterium]|nr:hypothetical protein [Clostridia bacterium]